MSLFPQKFLDYEVDSDEEWEEEEPGESLSHSEGVSTRLHGFWLPPRGLRSLTASLCLTGGGDTQISGDTWLASSSELPARGFGSGSDLRRVRRSPMSGSAWSRESAQGPLSLPLPLPLFPMLTHSLK